jgi:heparosan-N-sulfate-glucuronate 5-epimerase
MKIKSTYLSRVLNAYFISRQDSNLTFWHTPLSINELDDYDINNVRRYPMNFVAKTAFKNHRDSDSVIMLNYHGAIGLQYNPNAIAQQALGYYDEYLGNPTEKRRDAVLTQANYFLKYGRAVQDDILLWEYNFPFEMRNHLSAPWRSALAQGQAISVLIRAHQITGDDIYAEMAHRGYRAFHFLAREHEGGVLDDQNGFTWLEEYIVTPSNHVLNGFIWTLWGVRDYAAYFGNNHAENLWRECLKTLEVNLKNYDLGFWTSYDWPQGYDKSQPIMPSSLYYQRLHTIQMLACYNLTKKPFFLDYHKKWQGYLESFWKKVVSQTWKAYFKLRYF